MLIAEIEITNINIQIYSKRSLRLADWTPFFVDKYENLFFNRFIQSVQYVRIKIRGKTPEQELGRSNYIKMNCLVFSEKGKNIMSYKFRTIAQSLSPCCGVS